MTQRSRAIFRSAARAGISVLLASACQAATATSAYVPLLSNAVPNDDVPRFDGIAQIDLPTMRTVRTISVAEPSDYGFATTRPDGAVVAVFEPDGQVAIYAADSGALRHRWPSPPCGVALFPRATWHPSVPEILIVDGACFFNIETGVAEETPATLGVRPLMNSNFFPTVSDGGRYLVTAQAEPPPSSSVLKVRVIDLTQPRSGRDFAAWNGYGVIGFGETTLLSQVASAVRFTDLATGADLGPVPMPSGWLVTPPFRAFPDGSIVAFAYAGSGPGQQAIVRLRSRTQVAEFVAALPPIAIGIHAEIGQDFALVSDGASPGCVAVTGGMCPYGPTTITAIELSSGRQFSRVLPTQKRAADGPYLAGGGIEAVPVPTVPHAATWVALALAMFVLAMWAKRARRQR